MRNGDRGQEVRDGALAPRLRPARATRDAFTTLEKTAKGPPLVRIALPVTDETRRAEASASTQAANHSESRAFAGFSPRRPNEALERFA